MQSGLMYWGACFPHGEPGPDCLRCSSPAYLNHTPVQEVILVPDCTNMNPTFSSVKVALDQIGSYIGIGVGIIVLCFLILFTVSRLSRYRHYGVYNTGEKDDRESSILTDPIHVLERESDSYVNLNSNMSISLPFYTQVESTRADAGASVMDYY